MLLNFLIYDYIMKFGAVVVWLGSVVDCVSEVNQHQARLVLGWVTIPVCN